MRPTSDSAHAIRLFTSAMKSSTNVKSLKDLAWMLTLMAEGCKMMAQAIGYTYDKLEQIERKLSSNTQTTKTPRM